MKVTSDPVIILAKHTDTEALAVISRQTFIDTYASVNTPENMQDYLSTHFSDAATVKQLAEPGTQFYLVELDRKIIGYLKLNSGKAQTDLQHANTFEIERIYVLSEFKGKGIGKLLVNKAIALAKQNNADYLWLGVWEHNLPALAFYTKLGFIEFNRHIFKLGDDDQTDLMMKLELN